jgi:hypothetical protein
LTLLNDPASFEAARALGSRVIAVGGDARSRAAFGIKLVLSRAAKPTEVDRLVSMYEQELDHYRVRDGAVAADLAAWTMVANVLLNLDEAVTKE